MSEDALPGGWVWTRLGIAVKKPQMNSDEPRFANLDNKPLSEVFLRNYLSKPPQSSQRMQSSTILTVWLEKAQQKRISKRMIRIGQIFTNPRASASSAQSVFHRLQSVFICVHLWLIFDKDGREAA